MSTSPFQVLRDMLRPPVSLRGRVVLISGASSGIGRAAAEAFAGDGARVVLAARRAAELKELEDALTGRGAAALAVPTDVTSDAALEQLVNKAMDSFGRIDVLVNNAGVALGGRLHELAPQDLHRMLNVNLHGSFRLTQLVVPHLIAQRSGHVVFVSSITAYANLPALSVYVATKAALVAFASALRREVAEAGVHVSTVLPAATRTAMMNVAIDSYLDPSRPQPVALKPLGRIITGPEVPAQVIVDAVRYRRREVMMGGPTVTLTTTLEKLAPALIDRAFARLNPDSVFAALAKIGAVERK